jgi:hypothetical protein
VLLKGGATTLPAEPAKDAPSARADVAAPAPSTLEFAQ